MDDYWRIVLLLLDIRELIILLQLNKDWKHFVSLFNFEQHLTATSLMECAKFLSNVSRIRYLSLPFFEANQMKEIMPKLCKLNFLLFLDLWTENTARKDSICCAPNNLWLLPSNLIALRIDLDCDFLKFLPTIAPQLQHLTIYCYHSRYFESLVMQILVQFKFLKCVHVYKNVNDNWSQIPDLSKLPFAFKFSIYEHRFFTKSIICEHVTKKRKK